MDRWWGSSHDHHRERVAMSETAQRGIRFTVYRPAGRAKIHEMAGMRMPDYPTNALDAVTVVGEGINGRDTPGDEAPAFRLVKRVIFGDQVVWHLEPAEPQGGYSPGGNWAMTSVGGTGDFPPGFPRDHPIPVFDRVEKPLRH